MRRTPPVLIALVSAMATAGCAPSAAIPEPPGGYPALRFTQTVRIANLPGNYMEFWAGSVLVGDRASATTGERLYCGQMAVRDWFGQEIRGACVAKRDRGFVLVSSDGIELLRPRDVPADDLKEITTARRQGLDVSGATTPPRE